MKAPNDGSQMPPAVLQKLREVRTQDRRVRLWTCLWRGIAILLAAMLVAMTVDWLVVLYDSRSRWAVTLAALVIATVGSVVWGLIPLLRTRSLASIARQVDLAHPALEERYSTLAEVAQSTDAPELRGSESMIRKVAEQAASMSSSLATDAVVQRSGLIRAMQYCAVVSGVLLLMFGLDFSRARILCQRFWAPGSEISLTQLQARPGDITIGKGETVTLEFIAKGKKNPSANLFIRSANGRNEVVPLKRRGTKDPEFAYTRASVLDAFEYRARSGDGQTAWYRVAVAERPKITQTKLRIIPPAYSRLPVVEEQTLPHRVRALEGSTLEVSFQADQPLASMELKFSDGKTQALTESPDRSYRFNTSLTNTFALTPVLTNRFHLDNQPKSTCEIAVYRDEAPAIKVSSPSDEITARPDDKVKIEFEARDDFGIADARLVVTIKGDTNTTSVVIPIPLKDDTGKKLVRKEVELDLAQFNLKQDQELSYVVQVTDTKENLNSDSAQSSQKDQNQSAQSSGAQKSATEQQQTNSANDAKSPTNNVQSAANNAKPTPQSHEASPLRPDPQTHLALNAKPSEPRPPSEGSQPPPNDMVKRVLDAGQCSSCQPMRILVDEWGRSFEGQMREKLEIAIDPVLRQLDELLGKAQDLTVANLAAGKSPGGLSQKQNAPLEASRGHLRQADSMVTELKSKTHGTPYAFIGLQLHDIRDTHLSPARLDLGKVSLEPANGKNDIANLEHASFEIRQSREKLAALTKSYAEVKRDYKLADAMQRLKKMHQIFLEDTQAMLGSKKPTLNPQDRKVAEVGDDYVEKLRKLLEEKKKIMAELAKILADDPRMLRRFLALQELEGTSLRDQMTLLGQRQQSLAQNVAQWAGDNATNRGSLLRQILTSQAAEQNEVAELAAKMHENMVTWLPLDAKQDADLVVECRKLGAEVARLSAEASENTLRDTNGGGLEAAHKSLEQLRALSSSLPQLEWSQWTENPKLKMFAANRMTEVAVLITRQSGWIKKVEAIRAGDYPQAAEVDQHRLNVDTQELSEKLDATALQVSELSAEIGSKAEELNGTVDEQILPEQSGATYALSKKTVREAATHQTAATSGFATAEKQFDELLRLIIAKLDAAPPPTDPGVNKTLEEMLAMLQDEQKACESLGIPCRPMNVSIMRDWLKSGSGSGQQAAAQARVAQNQARLAAERAERLREQARKLAQQRASGLADAQTGPTSGPKRPAKSWNTLVSQLGDELRQGRDNVPPEQYRQAIEQYFNTISERTTGSGPKPGR